MQLRFRNRVPSINACDEARALARLESGHIRVGTLSSLSIGIITRTLGHLRRAYPGITVSMREDFNGILIQHAASGETDLSVCSRSGPGSGLDFEALFDDELMVVVKHDHPRARRKWLTWADLEDEALVMTMRHTSTREHISDALAVHGIVKPAEIEVASMPTALAMVREGFGITFISRVALLDLDIRGLVKLRMRDPAVRRMGIYRRVDRTSSPATEKFAELLRSEVNQTVRRLGTGCPGAA